MAKLSLTASPTFTSKVMIPVPGSKAVQVEFKFKGRKKDEFQEFLKSLGDCEDPEAILLVATGWDLEDVFNEANVELLVQNYIGAARAILEKYISEVSSARLGN